MGGCVLSEDLKQQAAAAAMSELRPGMKLGLGTGSTARLFVDLVGKAVADGLDLLCVPTSERTAAQARELAIPLSDLETLTELDLTVDGADEIGPGLALIKGAGGALLREKVVAAASKRMVVIADRSKHVATLGSVFPVPIEVNLFGIGATTRRLERIAESFGPDARITRRLNADGSPFVTDGGHAIVDALFGRISQPEPLSATLLEVPGVVQHGLFLGLCQRAYIAGPDGVDVIDA